MNSTSSGVSLSTVLVVVFVVLKLTDVIDWSWWWVFSPWIISVSLALIVLIFTAIIESTRR